MQIEEADLSDCLEIANIHTESLEGSFLSSLGIRFLNILYRTLVEYKEGFLIIAQDNKQIVGFVSGAVDTRVFFKHFLKKNIIKITFLLLPNLFNIAFLRKALEIARYTKRDSGVSLPRAELLSIAVKVTHRDMGIGKQLFKKLANDFCAVGISEFRIIVGARLAKAKKFYQNMECKRIRQIELHRGEESEIYVFASKEQFRTAESVEAII